MEEVEDVSEEACIARHDRSELDERRKFMSYLKQPAGVTRGRRRVDQIDRLDSRADQSSGANTPDPMSPMDSKVPDGVDVDLPVEEGERSVDTTVDGSFTASAIKERRRTASLTKRDSSVWKFDDNSGMSWDMDEVNCLFFFLFLFHSATCNVEMLFSSSSSTRLPRTNHASSLFRTTFTSSWLRKCPQKKATKSSQLTKPVRANEKLALLNALLLEPSLQLSLQEPHPRPRHHL